MGRKLYKIDHGVVKALKLWHTGEPNLNSFDVITSKRKGQGAQTQLRRPPPLVFNYVQGNWKYIFSTKIIIHIREPCGLMQ